MKNKTIRKRIQEIEQPVNGYVPLENFEHIAINEVFSLSKDENVDKELMSLATDYVTRSLTGTSVVEAFDKSLDAARAIDLDRNDTKNREVKNFVKLARKVTSMNNKGMKCALQAVAYNAYLDKGPESYIPVKEIKPDKDTLRNLQILIGRSARFFNDSYKSIVSGVKLDGAYTKNIDIAEVSYIADDTLFAFEVEYKKPTIEDTLALLMQYIMGMHSKEKAKFTRVAKLGIFNARNNEAFIIDIAKISKETIKEVGIKVIGYKNK